jgi:branched-chain amino acid transport system substrate-binding protein
MRFIGDMKKAGRTIDTIAMVNENTDYGTSLGDAVVAAAKEANLPVAIRIPYNANGTDVSAQVLQLKQANPSLIVFSSYTSDAILYMKTFKSLDYLPPMVIGDDGGFSDPSFIPAVGSLAQGAISRSAWSLGAPGSLSYRVNQVFKAKTGRDMDDVSGRCMEALFVLADALVRAGSSEPAKIQAALRTTNLGRDQMIVGYEGVKFDATGQNTLGSTYITQLQGTSYATVWPPAKGNPPINWPMKGWR